jgi:hypothetical protein
MEAIANKLRELGGRKSLYAKGTLLDVAFKDNTLAEKALRAARDHIAEKNYRDLLDVRHSPNVGSEIRFVRKNEKGAELLEKLREALEK